MSEQINTGVEQQGAADLDKPEKAFAARLNQERSKIEAEFAPYKDVIENQAKLSGMTSTEYIAYVKETQEREALEAEAEVQGKPVEQVKVEKEANEAKERLRKIERTEKLSKEEKAMVADPKTGAFVAKHFDQIRKIAEDTDTDMQTGLAIVLTEKLPELLDAADEEKIIKKYLASVKKGAPPMEIGGGTGSPKAEPAKTFEEAGRRAREMLRASKGD